MKERKELVIVPIAFVSEHSETLVELDIEGTNADKLAKYAITQLLKKKLVMHNASFDIRFTKQDTYSYYLE